MTPEQRRVWDRNLRMELRRLDRDLMVARRQVARVEARRDRHVVRMEAAGLVVASSS